MPALLQLEALCTLELSGTWGAGTGLDFIFHSIANTPATSAVLAAVVAFLGSTSVSLGRRHRSAQRDLAEAKAREGTLRETMRRAGVIYVETDMEGTIQASNGVIEAALGCTAEEFRTRPLAEWLSPDAPRLPLPSSLDDRFDYGGAFVSPAGRAIYVEMQLRLHQERDGRLVVTAVGHDQSRREEAERGLRQSVHRFESLTEQSPIPKWHVDLDGKTLYCNQALCDLLQMESPQQVLGRNWREFCAPEQLTRMETEFNKRKHGENSNYEIELITARGDRRFVSISGVALTDENGQMASSLATVVDLTGRRNMEQQLRMNEERFRRMFEEAPVPYQEIDREGIIRRVNRAECRLLGYREAELIGRPVWELVSSEQREATAQAIRRKLSGVQPLIPFVRELIRSDGRRVTVQVEENLIRDEKGLRQGLRWAMIDITEQRRAEEARDQLRRSTDTILNAAGDGIAGLDANGRITFINPAGAAMLGYPVGELLGRSFHATAHNKAGEPETCNWQSCAVQITLREGTVEQASEDVFWRKDGSAFSAEFACNPMFDEQGAVSGAVITFRDVTARRAVEHMKAEFVSVVSHELRTPLTSIRGALGLLASEKLGELPVKGRRMVQVASQNTDRLARLINDILDLERIESGKISLDPAPVQAAEILAQAAEEMRPLAEKNQIQIVVRQQEGLVLADRDRIVQTLTNLIGNAVKFSPEGASIELSSVASDNNRVLFRVRDHGRGIPAHLLETVFERFRQVDASDSRQKGGTGLGLSICRALIQQHGGAIWAENNPSGGSVFCFTLPELAQGELKQPGIKVLFGPDDALLDHNRPELEAVGLELLQAGDPEAVLVQGQLLEPRAIVLGLDLIRQNGWELVRELQLGTDTRHTPVLLHGGGSLQSISWLWESVESCQPSGTHASVVLLDLDPALGLLIEGSIEPFAMELAQVRSSSELARILNRTYPALLLLNMSLPGNETAKALETVRAAASRQGCTILLYNCSPEWLRTVNHELAGNGEAILTRMLNQPWSNAAPLIDCLKILLPPLAAEKALVAERG